MRPGTICIVIGAIAIAVAGALWLYNEYDDRQAFEYSQQTAQDLFALIISGDNVRHISDSLIEADDGGEDEWTPDTPGISVTPDIPDTSENADDEDSADTAESTSMTYIVVNRVAYMGVISIPKLRLDLPVNLTWSYPALRRTPCRYSGDTQHNNLVIAAHSYRTHFRDINTLVEGDVVTFTDVEGTEFNYRVVRVETLQPTDVREVVNSPYDLTLFTCTYDSRARVVVRCMMNR